MNKVEFIKIIEKIAGLAVKSEKFRGITSISFSNLTVGKANKLISEARGVMSDQDIFLKSELYHLIGMSDLTDEQLLVIMKLTKLIASSRSYLKPIASMELIKVPGIPDVSNYKCKYLGIKLEVNL